MGLRVFRAMCGMAAIALAFGLAPLIADASPARIAIALTLAVLWTVLPAVFSHLLILLALPVSGTTLWLVGGLAFWQAAVLWFANGAGVALGAMGCLELVTVAGGPTLARLSRATHRQTHGAARGGLSPFPWIVKFYTNSLFTLICEGCMAPLAVWLLLVERAILGLGLSWDHTIGGSRRGGAAGPCVIFVHGLGFNESQWIFARIVFAALFPQSLGAELLSLNLHRRGFCSTLPDDTDTIELYATRLGEMIAARAARANAEPRTVVLVGHSLGGLVASRYAQQVSGRLPGGWSLAGIVTISSPFRGADVLPMILARPLLARVMGLGEAAVHLELLPSSPVLRALRDGPVAAPRRVAIAGRLDVVVRPHSATAGAVAEDTVLLPHPHHYNIILSRAALLEAADAALGMLGQRRDAQRAS